MDARQRAVIQHPHQIKVRPQLPRRQAEQLSPQRPPAEQVAMTALKLPGARSAQGEVNRMVLMQPMRLVQQRGHLLHLVDHHKAGTAPRQLFAQKLRFRGIAAKLVRFQQIDPDRRGVAFAQQCRLARLPGSPEEKRLCSPAQEAPMCA